MNESKDYIIKIYDQEFSFTKPQFLLLSSSAFSYFKNNSDPFELVPPSAFDQNQVISCFSSIYLLFENSLSIEINSLNQKIFQFFGDFLDNKSLLKACKFPFNSFGKFSFSFSRFFEVNTKTINSLHNFEIEINDQIYQCSSSLLCCLSDLVFHQFQLEKLYNKLSLSVPDEILPVFESIFDHFNGNPIIFDQFPIHFFLISFEKLQILAAKDLLQSVVPKPISLEEAITFVSQEYSDYYQHLQQSAFQLFTGKLDSINSEFFNSLSF